MVSLKVFGNAEKSEDFERKSNNSHGICVGTFPCSGVSKDNIHNYHPARVLRGWPG